MTTAGDDDKDAPLLSMERGMFVKGIEAALLTGDIHVAVHSAKDLPSTLPDGLTIAAFPEREDPRDVLVNRWRQRLQELPAGARIGTSSPRRTAQVRALRPDILVLPIRGNVETRLEKTRGNDYDGAILAAAGLHRLGARNEIAEYLSLDTCTPDVGQGALAIECRTDDVEVLAMLASLDHQPTSAAVRLERAFLATIEGGCQSPVAAHAVLEGGELRVSAMAATPDGSEIVRCSGTYPASDPESGGRSAAESLLAEGAGRLISAGGA
jgi:hydroxymethylbilane synthase